MNDIKKNAVLKSLSLTEEELVKINQFALKELTADEVFTFKLAACNNDIDRDFEAFTSAALHKLAELYVGKTIIQDHRASTANQCARIYDAEVEATGETSKTGEPFERLILHCYCLRANNEELIADIEAGIKKECSVGCAIGKAICSICEQDNAKSWCEHYPSKTYDGRLCYFKLCAVKESNKLRGRGKMRKSVGSVHCMECVIHIRTVGIKSVPFIGSVGLTCRVELTFKLT